MPVSNNPTVEVPMVPIEETVTANLNDDIQIAPPSPGVQGLSEAEMSDPNNIDVTIADEQAPLVVLFGPPSCGKTMTLVRMARFLQSKGYIVAPIRTFRPSSDTNYKELCDNFNTTINRNNAANSTNRISFMLVEVIKNGHRICQILEAPGEYYFNPTNPNADFPNYFNTICSRRNRKIWAIMVEPNWKDTQDRKNYVTRIGCLKGRMRPKDKTIFIYNKIDMTNFVFGVNQINRASAIQTASNEYPNIFVPFMNTNPITKYVKKYNCDFVPFQTGYYTQATNGITYQEGPDEYCANLWNAIMNGVKG